MVLENYTLQKTLIMKANSLKVNDTDMVFNIMGQITMKASIKTMLLAVKGFTLIELKIKFIKELIKMVFLSKVMLAKRLMKNELFTDKHIKMGITI